MKRHGLVIYSKDIQLITGRSEAYARRALQTIRKKLGKEKHQFVTYEEFSKFSGLTMEEIDGICDHQKV